MERTIRRLDVVKEIPFTAYGRVCLVGPALQLALVSDVGRWVVRIATSRRLRLHTRKNPHRPEPPRNLS